MSQLCRVCGEPAAGFHFGAFTCEGCKSFFGRTYNNLGSITECKNQGTCVINKKNRTSCKACRLRKCLLVGMSKSGSRYGRRSNWFKIHCLLQEQQHHHQQQQQQQHHHQQQQQQQQHHQVSQPSASPPEKSPKGSNQSLGHRGVGLGQGLYGGGMLWAGPQLLHHAPSSHASHASHASHHGHHLPLPLPFPPFLPAAAAAAAAAFNGGVASPLFGVPPQGHQHASRHEWSRLASPLSTGSTSPPSSPRPRAAPKTVPAALSPPSSAPSRGPPGVAAGAQRRLPSPRIDVDVDADADAGEEQEEPMDLSRSASTNNHVPHRQAITPPSAIPLGQDADGEDCNAVDMDGSDSGVSERESTDRAVDGDTESERVPTRHTAAAATTPVDLSGRLS